MRLTSSGSRCASPNRRLTSDKQAMISPGHMTLVSPLLFSDSSLGSFGGGCFSVSSLEALRWKLPSFRISVGLFTCQQELIECATRTSTPGTSKYLTPGTNFEIPLKYSVSQQKCICCLWACCSWACPPPIRNRICEAHESRLSSTG